MDVFGYSETLVLIEALNRVISLVSQICMFRVLILPTDSRSFQS
jgi:hypothetical protein